MNLLYPHIEFRKSWRKLIVMPILGALIAGVYGIIHDQITYSLAPEYFTKFKFFQFHWLLNGQADRLIVAKIGFLATWWVGLICGWVIVRLSLRPDGSPASWVELVKAFGLILLTAVGTAVMGYFYGLYYDASGTFPSYWWVYESELELTDLPAFARVGYIHNFSYTGALCGLVIAGFKVWKDKKKYLSAS